MFGVLHFEKPLSEWSDKEAREFSNLMISGGACLSGTVECSSLAQSKLRNIGEKNAVGVDSLARLVAKKFTCRVCEEVDFSGWRERNVHERTCKQRQILMTCHKCGNVFASVCERQNHQKHCGKPPKVLRKATKTSAIEKKRIEKALAAERNRVANEKLLAKWELQDQ